MGTVEIIKKTLVVELKKMQKENQWNISDQFLEEAAGELTEKIEVRLRFHKPGLLEEQEWPET